MSLLVFIFLLISKITKNESYLLYNQDYLTNNYLLNGLFFIKIFLLLFITLLIMYMFYLNKYNVYFYTQHQGMFNVTKGVTLLLYTIYFLAVTYSVYIAVLHLYPFVVTFESLEVFLQLWLFVGYYVVMILLIHTYSKHFLLYFLPFILYFVSVYSVEIGIEKSMVSPLSKVLYLVFYDLTLYEKYSSYYPITYYVTILTIMSILIIRNVRLKDYID